MPAAVALAAGRPGAGTLAVSLPWVLAGLALRAWAFVHLGGQGRTRELRPPATRAVGGPYRLLRHPVYLANLLVAFGLVVACRPPDGLAWLLTLAVAAFYGLLATREDVQVLRLPRRRTPATGLAGVARSERSTWVVVGLFLLLSSL